MDESKANYYSNKDNVAGETEELPEIFRDIEVLHKLISDVERKLAPILTPESPSKLASNSSTDLDSRVKGIIERVATLKNRIKI